jgi:hypothetical protein
VTCFKGSEPAILYRLCSDYENPAGASLDTTIITGAGLHMDMPAAVLAARFRHVSLLSMPWITLRSPVHGSAKAITTGPVKV